MFVPDFKILTMVVPGKSLSKVELWSKRKLTKGLISRRRLILSYTRQLVIPNALPNFKALTEVVPEKSLTEIW